MFDEDMWTMQIEEVAITATRIKTPFDEPRLNYWANRYSDRTIRSEEFSSSGIEHSGVSSVIARFIPGTFVVERDGVFKPTIRGGVPDLIIDGLRIDRDDHSAWLIPVDEIESIDVFRTGLATISITTRRGSNIPVTTHNYAVYNPLGYQKPAEFYAPKYETLEAKRSVIPDLRTTIYWKPDIVISEDGKVSFEFYTSDFRATYSVVIEGITGDGRIVRQVEKIRVE